MKKMLWQGVMLGLFAFACVSGCDQVTVRERATPSVVAEGVARSAQVVVLAEGLEAAWLERLDGGLAVDAPSSSPAFEGVSSLVRLGPVQQRLPVSRFDLVPKQELTTTVIVFDALQMIVPVRFNLEGGLVICRWQVSSTNVVSTVDLAVIEGSEGYNLEPIASPLTQLTTVRVDAVGSCPVDVVEQPAGVPGELTREVFVEALSAYAEDAISDAVQELLSTSSLELLGLISGEIELSQPARLEHKQGVTRLAGSLSEPEPVPLRVANAGLSLSLDYAASFEPAACAPLVELDEVPAGEVMSVTQADVRDAGADMGVALSRGLLGRVMQVLTRAGFLCLGLERIGTAVESLSLRDVDFGAVGISETMFGDRVQYSVTPGALPEVTLNTTLGTVDVTLSNVQLELYTELFGTSVLASSVQFPVTLSLKIVPDTPGMMRLRLEAVQIGDVVLVSDWSSQPPEADALRDWTRRLVVLVFGESLRLPLPLRQDTGVTLMEARVRQGDVVFFLSF